jgi:hypothetical protein
MDPSAQFCPNFYCLPRGISGLDANDPTTGPRHDGVLWQDSFIDPARGVTPVPLVSTVGQPCRLFPCKRARRVHFTSRRVLVLPRTDDKVTVPVRSTDSIAPIKDSC